MLFFTVLYLLTYVLYLPFEINVSVLFFSYYYWNNYERAKLKIERLFCRNLRHRLHEAWLDTPRLWPVHSPIKEAQSQHKDNRRNTWVFSLPILPFLPIWFPNSLHSDENLCCRFDWCIIRLPCHYLNRMHERRTVTLPFIYLFTYSWIVKRLIDGHLTACWLPFCVLNFWYSNHWFSSTLVAE